ncbi:MAG TPA: MBOAT family O-acyltransferase [Clostridia bacterium]|nr:MBOAT family O-acyltransferase [Clostridia bacterium]
MVFSSVLFLFYFMPMAFTIYYLVPKRWKNLTLLILSLIFYSWGEVRYFPIMLASILVDYTASNGIAHCEGKNGMRRLWLLFSVVFNLGMLGFFKYAGFFARNINAITGLGIPILDVALPLGISFYTFQTMSYTIDVYRGDVKAERNIIDFGAFVVLFPQLIAGPIVRYTDIQRELRERTADLGQISAGARTFIMGLASKVLIANNVGALWTEVEAMGFSDISTPLAWLAILAFTLQIYFDFSGYSLMAIGLGRMLGFEFPQNFNFPYISKSMTEFWRRWHMTLGSWFRQYMYIPLGGNRKGTLRTVFNLLLVWAATGLWHGASWNFVLWGLFFFVLLMLEKAFLRPVLDKHPVFARIYMIPLIMVSWAIFAITDLSQLGVFFGKLFTFTGGEDWGYFLRNYGVTFAMGILFSTPALKKSFQELEKNRAAAAFIYGALLFVSIAYLVDATYNPFLYFRF